MTSLPEELKSSAIDLYLPLAHVRQENRIIGPQPLPRALPFERALDLGNAAAEANDGGPLEPLFRMGASSKRDDK